jgi:ubiquinone/menaquinone biosynthesis C-methylase UbiE
MLQIELVLAIMIRHLAEGAMTTQNVNFETAAGYEILAAAGKTILRPGGKSATERLLNWADFQPGERVLELASGLGTSAIALAKRYGVNVIGIEKDFDRVTVAQNRVKTQGLTHQVQILQGNVFELENLSQQFDAIMAEAILTMQSQSGKVKILQGVQSCLKPGGRFLAHELLAVHYEAEVHQVLSAANRVNAAPLSVEHWIETLENIGLHIQQIQTGEMRLLHPRSLVADEGITNTLNILWNIATQPPLRSRILDMRQVFQKYQQDLGYIILTTTKL